jgi:hypothetical protein
MSAMRRSAQVVGIGVTVAAALFVVDCVVYAVRAERRCSIMAGAGMCEPDCPCKCDQTMCGCHRKPRGVMAYLEVPGA